MKTYLQVTLDPAEKTMIENVIKGMGFRSAASFAYYAIMQQVQELKKKNNPFNLTDEQTEELNRSIRETEYAEIDLDNI